MSGFAVGCLLLLAMAVHSDANYCVCKSGLSASALQKNIDYVCGELGDCTQIQQNGPCYNPNTVMDHCNYAVNTYYQRRGQATGSCDFLGTATVTQNAPATSSGCVYLSGPSTGGIPTTGTPTAGGTPSIGTPTGGGTPGTPNIGGTTIPGSSMSPPFGLGPTASGFPSTDNSAGVRFVTQNVPFALVSIFTILFNGLIRAGI